MPRPFFLHAFVFALLCISQDVLGFAPSAVAVLAQQAPMRRTSTSVVVASPLAPSAVAVIKTAGQQAQRVPTARTRTSVGVASPLFAAPVPSSSSMTAAVPPKLQILLVLSSVLILAGYHINLFVKERKSNEKT